MYYIYIYIIDSADRVFQTSIQDTFSFKLFLNFLSGNHRERPNMVVGEIQGFFISLALKTVNLVY